MDVDEVLVDVLAHTADGKRGGYLLVLIFRLFLVSREALLLLDTLEVAPEFILLRVDVFVWNSFDVEEVFANREESDVLLEVVRTLSEFAALKLGNL